MQGMFIVFLKNELLNWCTSGSNVCSMFFKTSAGFRKVLILAKSLTCTKLHEVSGASSSLC